MSLSNYLENKLADHIVGKTAYAMPAVYLALSTSDPGEAGSMAGEPVGNGYARKATAGSDWAAASGGVSSNATVLSFATASGAWGTLTHFALMDAASGGNVLASGALAVAKTPTAGDVVSFAIGALTLTLD